MSAPCIGEPVSWLRLEQLALAELDAGGTADVRTHLDACAACHAAFARISDDARPLPALPLVALQAARPPWWRRWLVPGGGLVLAAAAVLLLLFRTADRAPRPLPEHAVRVKGAGVVVVTLVRERDGAIAFDPPGVRDGDRWKVQVTCAPGGAAWVDVAVDQRGEVDFGPAPQRIACGNDVVVPGAFRVTGGAATVCIAIGATPPDRTRLAAGDRRDTVCRALTAD